MDNSTRELVSFWVSMALIFELPSIKAASFLSAWLSCWLPAVHLLMIISFGIMGLCFVSASIQLTHVESYPHSMPLWHWEHLESFRSRNLVKDLFDFQIIRQLAGIKMWSHPLFWGSLFYGKKSLRGCWDSSAGKVIHRHTWHPQFDPCDSQSRKKSWSPRSCPLTSMCGQQDLFIHPYIQAYEMKESKCSIFLIIWALLCIRISITLC